MNLYQKRIDDMGFAFTSGNAKDRFNALERDIRVNINDYLKKVTEQKPKVSPM